MSESEREMTRDSGELLSVNGYAVSSRIRITRHLLTREKSRLSTLSLLLPLDPRDTKSVGKEMEEITSLGIMLYERSGNGADPLTDILNSGSEFLNFKFARNQMTSSSRRSLVRERQRRSLNC